MIWKEFGSLGTSEVSIRIRNPQVSSENDKGLCWCFNGVSTKRVWVSRLRVIVVITFFFSSVSFKCNRWILNPKTLPSTLLLQEEAPFELELVAISRILIYKFQLFDAAVCWQLHMGVFERGREREQKLCYLTYFYWLLAWPNALRIFHKPYIILTC